MGRRSWIIVLAMLAGAALAPVGVPGGGAVAAPAVATRQSPESASQVARRTGQQVEVTSARTETGELVANPDGTFTARESVLPVRVRRGADWVPVDTTLRVGRDG